MSLEERKILGYAKNIRDLPDYPIDRNMTADELKAYFDSRTDDEVMRSINGIIDELKSNNAASQIMTSSGESIEGRIIGCENDAEGARERLYNCETRLSVCENEINSTKSRVVSLEDGVSNHESRIKNTESYVPRVIACENEANSTNSKVVSLEKSIANHESRIKNTESLELRVSTCEEENENMLQMIDDLEGVVSENKSEQAGIKTSVETAMQLFFGHEEEKNNPHRVTASQISTTLDKNVDAALNDHDVALADLKEDLGDIDLALDAILNIQEALIGGESA